MTRRPFGRVARRAFVLLAFVAAEVHAQGSSAACANPRIHVEGELAERWAAAVAHLCERFGTMTDVDPTATLRIVPKDDDVVLEVTLGEGRTAVRRLHSPDDLPTVAEALTVVIPEPRSEHPAPTPAVNQRPEPVPPSPPLPAKKESAAIHVELGIGIEGRLSGSTTYLSAGGTAYAGLRPGDWLFAVLARWQPSEVPAQRATEGFEMESAGAGFLVARRLLQTGWVALEAGASAMLLVDTQSIETRTPDEVGSAADARFGMLVRAPIGKGPWRFAPSIDADVAPSRIRRTTRIDPALPPLPKWSVGFGLGLNWTEP
jgi:hypothetical protein